jgi:ADP-ribose pyrophosphatase
MKKVSEKLLFEGKWLCLKEQHFLNNKQPVFWESVARVNTRKILVVLARMKPSNRYVLIKQFRPSINNTVIGFPAGLMSSDDPEKDALKELKEETGYSATITDVSPELAFNPAMTDETVQIIHAEIDETDPTNSKPVQKLEPAEEIEVVLVEKNKIKEYLLDEQKKGVAVAINIWYLFGISI